MSNGKKKCVPIDGFPCNNFAITKRVTAGNITRDLCSYHASIIDRAHRIVEKDKHILDRLKRLGD